MRLRKVIGVAVLLIGVLFHGCLDPYSAPKVGGSSNYLVVSGFLNAGNNSCTITLTRSEVLSSSNAPAAVSDAAVFVEDENGSSAALTSGGNGVYSNLNIPLISQRTYRLHIITSNGEAYFSDYVPVNQSQTIDSVGWTLKQLGSSLPNVNIYVTAHGSPNQSPYYLWNYTETWQYTAPFANQLKLENGEVITNNDSTYFCWSSSNSTSILIASSSESSQNVVSNFLLTDLPINSIKLYQGYSILVTQLSITEDAFQYWQQLEATTENLGTIFGPLPSQFSGNIHSATNPSEPVFGYFSASSVSQKRIFIKPGQVPFPPGGFDTGYENCQLGMLPANKINDLSSTDVLVTSYGVGPVGYYITSESCVDCRLKGGTNVKPSFWY
jgi:hypothetical protein